MATSLGDLNQDWLSSIMGMFGCCAARKRQDLHEMFVSAPEGPRRTPSPARRLPLDRDWPKSTPPAEHVLTELQPQPPARRMHADVGPWPPSTTAARLSVSGQGKRPPQAASLPPPPPDRRASERRSIDPAQLPPLPPARKTGSASSLPTPLLSPNPEVVTPSTELLSPGGPAGERKRLIAPKTRTGPSRVPSGRTVTNQIMQQQSARPRILKGSSFSKDGKTPSFPRSDGSSDGQRTPPRIHTPTQSFSKTGFIANEAFPQPET